ncbi:hypothetical protein [Actinoplanes sp. G11-F43]|uniref:hypothetical protein n=1 Tax=Actinoplanes sp. G11-F43 TaxID=3424130 RepID=UPI003D32D29D
MSIPGWSVRGRWRSAGGVSVSRLANLLEQPVAAGFNPPPRHCTVSNNATDPVLPDEQWASIAAEYLARMDLFIGTVSASAQATRLPPADGTFDYVRPTKAESDHLDTAVSPAPWPTRQDPTAEHRGGRPLLGRERRTFAAMPRR